MDKSNYSQLKPLWHRDRLAKLAGGEIPAPVHVQMVISDLCNQDCGFCAYRMSGGLSRDLFVTETTHNPNRKMPTEKALELVAECADIGVRAIQFTGGGEPTVHPDHLLIFGQAQARGLETALVTNGVRLKPDAPMLGHTWVRVSVDAGDAETYARLRRVTVGHWQMVWTNVEAFARQYPGELGIGFVVTSGNWQGMAAAAARAREAGAKSIRIGAVFSKAGRAFYSPNELAAMVDLSLEVEAEYSSADFKVVNMFGRRLHDLDQGAPASWFCGYQYLTTYIGADLNVYRCCNTAYSARGKIGSIADRPLREVTPGGPTDFDARGCTFCQFHGQNAAIAAAVFPPAHAAFV